MAPAKWAALIPLEQCCPGMKVQWTVWGQRCFSACAKDAGPRPRLGVAAVQQQRVAVRQESGDNRGGRQYLALPPKARQAGRETETCALDGVAVGGKAQVRDQSKEAEGGGCGAAWTVLNRPQRGDGIFSTEGGSRGRGQAEESSAAVRAVDEAQGSREQGMQYEGPRRPAGGAGRRRGVRCVQGAYSRQCCVYA